MTGEQIQPRMFRLVCMERRRKRLRFTLISPSRVRVPRVKGYEAPRGGNRQQQEGTSPAQRKFDVWCVALALQVDLDR